MNLADVREKYSASAKQTERATARKGALALISNKVIKTENALRYKKILSEKVGPSDVLAQFQRMFSLVSTGIGDWASRIKLEDIETVKQYGEFVIDGWNTSPGFLISKIYDEFGRYMYDYVQFARNESRIERLADCIENGKTEEGDVLTDDLRIRYSREVEYYQDELKRAAIKFVEYKQTFDRYEKQVTEGLSQFDRLLTPEGKSELPQPESPQ
jgi:hypothetical protein